MAGSFLGGIALMTMGGLGVPQPVSYSYSQGIVAMMLVFQLVYVATIGPLYYTVQAETPATRLRDKTVRLGATVNIVTMYVS
jgi:SP family general alpha glucoside:H+ symporter-like MFS transporter